MAGAAHAKEEKPGQAAHWLDNPQVTALPGMIGTTP